MRSRLYIGAFGVAIGLLAYGQNYAAPPAPQVSANAPMQDGSDPDAALHGVARLSLMYGGVSVAHGNMGEMAAGVLNAALLTEDRVLTASNGRAEVQLDGSNQVRIAGSTEVRMGDLQYKRYQVQIAQGTITFRVLHDNDAAVEISTPTVSVRPLKQGTYRVSVNAEGLTEVTVRAGDAEISSPSGTEPLRAGQTLQSRGNPADPEFRTTAMASPDDWDRWNMDRDRFFETAPNVSQNVGPDVYGTEDLNGYGRWTNDPAYGNVWVPNQGPDWAPYQDGRWVNLDYYGWTWVGYEPWGWAPYHYGRWYRGSFGWAWYPGGFGVRRYWSPALVGFFGWGYAGFGASFGFGNIGWVPLAPYEAYRPWYGRGVRSVGFVGNVGIAETFRNARINGAVTSVRAGDFGRSAVNGASVVRATPTDLSHASMFTGGVPISGARASSAAGAQAGFARNSPRFYSSPAFSSTRAPIAGGVSNNGVINNGAASAGGWRRIDPSSSPSTSGYSRAAGSVGGANGAASPNGSSFAPRPQGFQNSGAPSYGGSQPVRIAPPMVNSRPSSGVGSSSAPSGFGSPRPNYGSSGGFSRPAAPQGGGVRSAPSAGHASSGGHSSHR